MLKHKPPYKSKIHAARAFAKRYMQSHGGGWFSLGSVKMRGLHAVASYIIREGYALPWSDGRVEMHFEFTDPCIKQRRAKAC